jgi:hypothetical protein
VEDEAADEDASEEDPVVDTPSSAVARVDGRPLLERWDGSSICSPTPSESRATGRRFAGRTVGFVGSDVEAPAEGLGSLTTIGPADASSVFAVSVTSLVNVTVSVDICSLPVAGSVDLTCSARLRLSIDVTGGETSAFPVSVTCEGGSLVSEGTTVAFASTVAVDAAATADSGANGMKKLGIVKVRKLKSAHGGHARITSTIRGPNSIKGPTMALFISGAIIAPKPLAAVVATRAAEPTS